MLKKIATHPPPLCMMLVKRVYNQLHTSMPQNEVIILDLFVVSLISCFSCSESMRHLHDDFIFFFLFSLGVILRPGFIHGTRRVGSVKIPLGLVGSPMQMVMFLSPSFNSFKQ